MDECLQLLDTISADYCFAAEWSGADLLLNGVVGTQMVIESRRTRSFLLVRCWRRTDSKSELRMAKLTFSALIIAKITGRSLKRAESMSSASEYHLPLAIRMSSWCSDGLHRRTVVCSEGFKRSPPDCDGERLVGHWRDARA